MRSDMTKTYDIANFDYNKDSDTFIGEASELFDFDGRAFNIHNQKTGNLRMFLIDRREFSDCPDREFIAWHGYNPSNGHKVVVFND